MHSQQVEESDYPFSLGTHQTASGILHPAGGPQYKNDIDKLDGVQVRAK